MNSVSTEEVCFNQVVICPKTLKWFPPVARTIIFCDCRAIVNINRPGIYFVKSNRGAKSKAPPILTEHQDDTPIRRVRIFHKPKEYIVSVEKPKSLAAPVLPARITALLTLDGVKYKHRASDLDLIISTSTDELSPILLVSPGEKKDV